MIEKSPGQELAEIAIAGSIIFLIVLFLSFQMGVITPDEPPKPAVENITVIENVTPEITTIATPEPTPTEAYVDPFFPGMRSMGQWYKWYRSDVQGLKDMQIGIVAYRYKELPRYTWWNPATSNYYTQRPGPNNKYIAVWVHEEMIGANISHDPSFWAFDDKAFALQTGNTLHHTETNVSFNPVVRIKEFDEYTDYYDSVTAPPFGYYIRYTGHNPESGGFAAEKIGVLRMGKGNAHDGFILFEVPKETKLQDTMLIGEFGTFGSAQWRLLG